jgi:hypothetical protein
MQALQKGSAIEPSTARKIIAVWLEDEASFAIDYSIASVEEHGSRFRGAV